MILTSHILAEIQERVDRLAIMAAGRIRALGTVQALREEMSLPLWIEVRPGSGGSGTLRALLGGSAPISRSAATNSSCAVRAP
jgi:Cu-processing system ATP-binding protein